MQSKVWVHAALEGEKLQFTADSDAIITKGIIAILIVLSQPTSPSHLRCRHPFYRSNWFKRTLVSTRANGLVSMIKQIKLYAIAFQTQLN